MERPPTSPKLMSPTSAVAARPKNPGLEPFDISEYRGVEGQNFYDMDLLLQRIVARHSHDCSPQHKQEMTAHLRAYGALVGGPINALARESHKEGRFGEIVHFDRAGNRIDQVKYCREQEEARRLSYEHGIVNLDFHSGWKHPFTMTHRMALAYLSNQNGEHGVTCPLAMTDGIIRGIKALGTEDQKARFLPLVAGQGSASHFMAGQYVTERVGGSNVAANRTVARKRDDGRWILNGEKWFCSNPGDLWVTTARIEGTHTIGMFLVSRLKADGTLNGCHLLRKKDIIGSRGKITVETLYEDCEAEELGRPAHGLANLIKYIINTSRIHVAVSAAGMARRAYMEAAAYARAREAYGRKIIEFPSLLRTLAEMQIQQCAFTMASFQNFVYMDTNHAATSVVTPLLKYAGTVHATYLTHEAMMVHGGNGILGDFSCLPRLHNDAIINETWEGTHQIISEHVTKAFARPKVREAFFREVASWAEPVRAHKEFERACQGYDELSERLREMEHAGDNWIETNRLAFCNALYGLFALGILCREALEAVGDERRLFTAMAAGFAEIQARGVMGPAERSGVFAGTDSLERIVAYC